MKVIDLVKQIALKNIPKRIKYSDYEWEYDGENYKMQASSGTYMNWDYIIFNCLNDEVEIIGEHKIPEKLTIGVNENDDIHINNEIYGERQVRVVADKVNEIIDYLEEENE